MRDYLRSLFVFHTMSQNVGITYEFINGMQK